MGNKAASAEINEKVLAVRRQTLGHQHQLTHASAHNLAGDYTALDDIERATALREEFAGASDGTTSAGSQFSGVSPVSNYLHQFELGVLQFAGKTKMAQGQRAMDEALAGVRRVVGVEHPAYIHLDKKMKDLHSVGTGDIGRIIGKLFYVERESGDGSIEHEPALNDRIVEGSGVEGPRLKCWLMEKGARQPTTEQYVRRLMKDGPGQPGPGRQMLVHTGKVVLLNPTAILIQNLTGAPELNGQRGVIHGFDEERQRYQVKLAGRKNLLGIRMECCGLVLQPGVQLPGAGADACVGSAQAEINRHQEAVQRERQRELEQEADLKKIAHSALIDWTTDGLQTQVPKQRLLLEAAATGDVATMAQLLEDGVNINALVPVTAPNALSPGAPKLHMTPLLGAMEQKQEVAMRWLLEHGADPDLGDSFSPLWVAVSQGDLAAVRILLDVGVALDFADSIECTTAFHCACLSGHAECAMALVVAGCDTKLRNKMGLTGRQMASLAGHRAVDAALQTSLPVESELKQLAVGCGVLVQGLVKASQHNGRMGMVESYNSAKGRYRVSFRGEAKAIQVKWENLEMLDHDQSKQMRVARLNDAVVAGDIATMARMVEAGADVNDIGTDCNGTVQTLLCAAIGTENAKDANQEVVAQWLLNHGANPSLASGDGQTPLMLAASIGSVSLVRVLLGRGVPLDAVERRHNSTAVHAACFHGHATCVSALVAAGCDTGLRTKSGDTPKEMAQQNGHWGKGKVMFDVGTPCGKKGQNKKR